MTAVKTFRPSEAECQRTIVATALRFGWRVHDELPGLSTQGKFMTRGQGQKGWPDLFLVKGDTALALELKRRPNKVEDEQLVWLGALQRCGIDARVVWVPEGMPQLLEELGTRHTEPPTFRETP